LADNFALVAALNAFFLAFVAGLTERCAGLAATLFFAEALMARFFFGAAPDLADPPRMLRSSLFKASICSFRGSPFELVDGQVIYTHQQVSIQKAGGNQGQ